VTLAVEVKEGENYEILDAVAVSSRQAYRPTVSTDQAERKERSFFRTF
jgi:hypothetical protein